VGAACGGRVVRLVSAPQRMGLQARADAHEQRLALEARRK
jgi:hypothetical protein